MSEIDIDIDNKYARLGGQNGFLGKPVSNESACADGVGRFCHYERGSIYWHPQTGVHEVHGLIREKWKSMGWEKSFMGYPLTDELPTPDTVGRFNHFQGGSIYWRPQFDAFEVHGLIRDKWAQLGWERGFLGYPTTDCLIPTDKIGRFTHFQGGSIYWWPQTGAFEVHGAIRDKWAALGWETGPLGYPTSDETEAAEGGRFNNFQRGAIYWHPQTGAHALRDEMLKKWREFGAENGVLGYPFSGETSPDGGLNWYQYFQRGSLHWQPAPDVPLGFAARLIEPVQVIRPDDLLALGFEFSNLKLAQSAPNKPPALVRAVPTEKAFVIVHFPPQNIAEEAFFETALNKEGKGFKSDPPDHDEPDENKLHQESEGILKKLPVAQTRLSGPSRLVFEVPLNVQSVGDFTLANLLQCCTAYPLSLAPAASPPQDRKRSKATLRTSLSDILSSKKKDEPATSLLQAVQYSRAEAWGKRSTAAQDALPRPVDIFALNPMFSASPRESPKLQTPTLTITAIEAPYRLILSPNQYGVWLHATEKPVTSAQSGRTELWHTRLATRIEGVIDETDRDLRTVRAIWARSGADAQKEAFSPDPYFGPDHGNAPFRMSLDAFDRHNIVHLSANYNMKASDDASYDPKTRDTFYDPAPITTERLMLSALGAWINVRGAWMPPPWQSRSIIMPGLFPFISKKLAVEEWRHRGTMGRDHYVQVVYQGCLFPFGHRASLIKITERKFHDLPGNPAYLRQRMYIVVREPLKKYGIPALLNGSYDRQFPFASVRITTLVTPNLDPPEDSDYKDLKQPDPKKQDLLQSLFWPMVGGQPFQFHLIAEDVEGHEIEFTAPLIYVEASLAQNTGLLNDVVKADYEKPNKTEAWKKDAQIRLLHGQSLAFADSDKPGDTAFEVESITFGAEVHEKIPESLGQDHPKFYPAVRSAKVFIPALTHLAGKKQASEIKFYGDYLSGGFTPGKNKGQIFVELSGAMPKLDFSQKGASTGALLKPSMNISGLSRSLGPVAGNLKTIGEGKFNPDEFFGSVLDAKLFGVFELSKVIQEVDVSDFDAVPKFVAETLTAAQSFAYDLQAFSGYFNDLKKLGGTIASDLEKDINKISDALLKANLAGITEDGLKNFNTHLGALANALPAAAATVIGDARKNEIQKKLNHLKALLAKPGVLLKELNSFLNGIETAKEQTIRFEWKPKLKSCSGLKLDTAVMTIAVEKRIKTDGKTAPEMDVFCSLENFDLVLMPEVKELEFTKKLEFINIHFNKLQFIASPGKKPDVNVDLGEITFLNELSFVNALSRIIPKTGFSDPPHLHVTAEGISAGYSMALPNLAIGMYSLQNISLAAGFKLPFVDNGLADKDKELGVYFRFCERHAPFLLTVSALGGGGFVGITVGPDLLEVEGALEFGGNISIDFGVASGSVYVMAGIYITIKLIGKKAGGTPPIEGYLRMGGIVEVLGIICVSIEQRMALIYEAGKMVGRATIMVEIEMAFFSETVELSCERKFAGSAGDPTFAQLMEPDKDDPKDFPWQEYCEAFA